MSSILTKRNDITVKLRQMQRENAQLKQMLEQTRNLSNAGLTVSLMGHELNNVLTPLENYSQLALNNPEDKELSIKAHHKTVFNCQRARNILSGLRKVLSGEKAEKKFIPVLDCVNNCFELIARDFSKDGITLKIQVQENLEVFACPCDIEHILINLILNARDSMLKRGGTLSLIGKKVESNTVIEISDTGCGIEKEVIRDIFTPFFTTKNKGQTSGGTGLGLTFCKQIVEQYNGVITVESEKDKGTKFKIVFPHPSNIW